MRAGGLLGLLPVVMLSMDNDPPDAGIARPVQRFCRD